MAEFGGKQYWICLARLGRWPLPFLRAFASGRRGAVIIIVAVAMIPLLLAAGGAIDVARFYVAKARVQYALDAALLAAGASDPSADRNQIFLDYFAANYPAGSLGAAVPTAPDWSNPTTSVFTASATLTVPTVFLPLASIDNLVTTAQASVVRATTGVEVALVVDNSASMGDPAVTGGAGSKLEDLQVAAQELRTILFNNAIDANDVKMAVVPFTATVNIGIENANFGLTPAHQYPPGTEWKGCVEARANGNDVLDSYDGSTGASGKWPRYFAQSESDDFGDFVIDGVPVLFGLASECVNTWWDPTIAPTANPRSVGPTGHALDPPFPPVPDEGTFRIIDEVPGGNGTNGPNMGCPTPITALTSTQTNVEDAINALETWDKNGTMINLGAIWGLRVLSPDDPFPEGAPFTDTDVNKVIILLTDGANRFAPQKPRCRDMYDDGRYSSHYTGYGYLSEGRAGTTDIFVVEANLNMRLLAACTEAKNAGITIYTIVFGDGVVPLSPTAVAMESCATSSSHYIPVANGTDLQTTFQAIGTKLVKLRLAQ